MNTQLTKLLDALSVIETRGQAPCASCQVTGICMDSRKATAGVIFVCIRGYISDGHQYASSAYERGTRIFLVEDFLQLPPDAYQILVDDTRLSLAKLSCAYFDNPATRMLTIGITGTKGKTTTALFIRHILENLGVKTGYIGTNGVMYADKHLPTANSTPESLVLQGHLYDMAEAGVKAVVMEVSSQGLWMHRVDGICFDVCLFTNLATDHVGSMEHPTFDHYKACKKMLFTHHSHPKSIFVVNQDDPAATYMTEGTSQRCVTVGVGQALSVTYAAHDIASVSSKDGLLVTYHVSFDGTTLPYEWQLPMIGEFNVQNALCALAVVHQALGFSVQKILSSLHHVSVPGRCDVQVFDALPEVTFVIDYAHNGVSMASTLDALSAYHPKRLICLFGSVGGRSQARRAELAAVAGTRADFCILTSDNPADEDPWQILCEIDRAFPDGSCPRTLVIDRREAIAYAVEMAQAGDIILLAGKGHETTQEIGGRVLIYNEKEVLTQAVACHAQAQNLTAVGEGDDR